MYTVADLFCYGSNLRDSWYVNEIMACMYIHTYDHRTSRWAARLCTQTTNFIKILGGFLCAWAWDELSAIVKCCSNISFEPHGNTTRQHMSYGSYSYFILRLWIKKLKIIVNVENKPNEWYMPIIVLVYSVTIRNTVWCSNRNSTRSKCELSLDVL